MNNDKILAETATIQEDDSSLLFWMFTILPGLFGALWWYFKNQKTQHHFSSSSHMSHEERRQKLAQAAAARLGGNPDDRKDAFVPAPSPQKSTLKVKRTVEPSSTESPQPQKQEPATAVATQYVPLQPAAILDNSKIEPKRETKEAELDPPLKVKSYERRQKLAQAAVTRLGGNPDDREDAFVPSPSPQKVTLKVQRIVEPASIESPQPQKHEPATAVAAHYVPLQPAEIPDNSKIERKRETKEAELDLPLKVKSYEQVTRKLKFPFSPKKPKRPPMIQIYCEGLSTILQINITIVETPGVGSWGGEGWWKRRPISSTLELISLPLFEHYSLGNDERVESIADSISELVGRELKFPSIQQAASWHFKLESTSRDGVSPFLRPGNEGFQEFLGILEDLQLRMASHVAKWIQQDSEENTEQNDEEDIAEGVLFADDYDQSIAKVATSTSAIEPKSWNEFIDLLSEINTLLVPRFLQKVADAHDKGASRSLTRRLFRHIFESLSMDNAHRSMPIHRYLTALSNTLVVTSLVSPAIVTRIQEEVLSLSATEKTGHQLEKMLQWSPLLKMAAYCLGPVDDSPGVPKAAFFRELENVPNFPLCAFSHPGDGDLHQHLQTSRRIIVMAQRTTEALIKLTIKKEKEIVFSWVKSIVKANQPLQYLAKSELLEREPGSIVSNCSTRSLLLGLTSSWINFCCQALIDRFASMGVSAFEGEYLLQFMDGKKDHFLFRSNDDAKGKADPNESHGQYTGATQFFFLTSALLRVGLHPALKMEQEFHQHAGKAFAMLRAHVTARNTLDQQPPPLSDNARKEFGPQIATWLGYKVFLEEPDFVTNVTNFALLQLRWVLGACRESPSLKVPDWMVKDPARWLAHVARTTPHLLRPHHAEQAVECSTELLQIGNTAFSPIVVTCLLRIASAFVSAGINRACERQRRLHGRRLDPEDDGKNVDIYLSFDPNDLGVTVFTNRLVSTKLCPSLIRTFRALDVVEGLDMDREYDFDKFAVKAEIADLFLRLWSHPSRECRYSVVNTIEGPEFVRFASSISAAVSVYFDDAVQKLATLYKTMRNQSLAAPNRDRQFIEAHSSSATGGFLGARRLLLLLCELSQEETIALSFGGGDCGNGRVQEALRELSNMIVHFLDITTGSDGGTHPELEMTIMEPTLDMAKRTDSMSPTEKETIVAQVISSRQFAREEIGFDVSVICYQLLALATRWHLAAAKTMPPTSSLRISPLLSMLAQHEDVEVKRYQQILKRLIRPSINEKSAASDDFLEVLRRDGHMQDKSSVTPESVDKVPEEVERRRRSAKKDQMGNEDIRKLASPEQIAAFLEDLERVIMEDSAEESQHIKPVELEAVQRMILAPGEATLGEHEYGDILSEWIVSSAPFANSSDGSTFLHQYDSTARSRNSGSGKNLVKEARRCHKALPAPHANSSCFLCFAEERMDLCRAIVTGPVDTPYAHGIFVFDIFFPADYPHVPPLVTFMTTGGGQVRFNPNLYVDGKVCLSLLGLTFATDESQRWNSESSSLAQILLSMQSQIFGVKEPYFNEGSGIPEHMRTTPAGREGSAKHNTMLRLATLRHAIVSQIRSPPGGFEEVSRRHFMMGRQRIVAQARRWMLEERGSPLYPRFEKIYSELLFLVSSMITQERNDCLPPLDDDLSRLEVLDPDFPRAADTGMRKEGNDSKPSTSEVQLGASAGSTHGTADCNPWDSPNIAKESQTEESDVSEDPGDDIYS